LKKGEKVLKKGERRKDKELRWKRTGRHKWKKVIRKRQKRMCVKAMQLAVPVQKLLSLPL
jgi:hypothetical protein